MAWAASVKPETKYALVWVQSSTRDATHFFGGWCAMSILDRVIVEFDAALRTLSGVARSRRSDPGEGTASPPLSAGERIESAGLMRVNHAGEVCAQALYRGQALGSSNQELKAALADAAREEEDHLAWSARRLGELGSRPSLLNPVWYAGSLGIGFAAAKAGDRWNLGFLRETEKQVEAHLAGHLERLSPRDVRTRAVIEQMAQDEAGHARTAERLGAAELPRPVRSGMRFSARLMTSTSYWI